MGGNKLKLIKMSEHKELRIGLIGCGFMGRAHSNAYNRLSNFFPDLKFKPVLKAVCSRSPDKVKAFAEQWNYESVETDWRSIVNRNDIDAIDICTPNDTHAEIAIAAAEAGKMILCEKPLAMNARQAEEMAAACRQHNVQLMDGTMWVHHPRSQEMWQTIQDGTLGDLRRVTAAWKLAIGSTSSIGASSRYDIRLCRAIVPR